MKRFILAFFLTLLPCAAMAACYQHPDTGVWHCYYASECPAGTNWNYSNQACNKPRYGCYATSPGGEMMICVDPPFCGPNQRSETLSDGTIICVNNTPQPGGGDCRIIIEYTPASPKTPLIYPVNGAICSPDSISDALVASLARFRGITVPY